MSTVMSSGVDEAAIFYSFIVKTLGKAFENMHIRLVSPPLFLELCEMRDREHAKAQLIIYPSI